MYLFMLMLVPVIIGCIGLFWSKGRITIKEFFTLEGAVFVVMLVGFLIARWGDTYDMEIWSGRIVDKKKVWVSCEHSYECNCSTDDEGNRSCQTCYEHFNDWDWRIYTSNGETITIDRVDRRGSYEPPRWTKAYKGEATAVAHSFENYIKANPDTILRRTNAVERFKNLVPAYPNKVYDYYRVNRFVEAGMREGHIRDWVWLLRELNADLGKKKQVNVIVVAVKTGDSSYRFALEEAWLGGKKNDLVIILGVPNYPEISWAHVMSWSRSEDLKVELRDAILAIGTVAKRDAIIQVTREMVEKKFVRRPWTDFKYLTAGLQPGRTATIILFSLGFILTMGLTVYFYQNDPFAEALRIEGRKYWKRR